MHWEQDGNPSGSPKTERSFSITKQILFAARNKIPVDKAEDVCKEANPVGRKEKKT